jgi:hypothetical protein
MAAVLLAVRAAVGMAAVWVAALLMAATVW